MKFVTVYKVIMLLQKRLKKNKEHDLDSFIAASVAGYFVFGDRTPVNEQVSHIIMFKHSVLTVFFCIDHIIRLFTSSRFVHPKRPVIPCCSRKTNSPECPLFLCLCCSSMGTWYVVV